MPGLQSINYSDKESNFDITENFKRVVKDGTSVSLLTCSVVDFRDEATRSLLIVRDSSWVDEKGRRESHFITLRSEDGTKALKSS